MPAFGRGIYAGASFEAGNAWTATKQISVSGLKYGMSLFLAADTSLGPLYFAPGCGRGRANAMYLFLGRP